MFKSIGAGRWIRTTDLRSNLRRSNAELFPHYRNTEWDSNPHTRDAYIRIYPLVIDPLTSRCSTIKLSVYNKLVCVIIAFPDANYRNILQTSHQHGYAFCTKQVYKEQDRIAAIA